MKTRPLGSAALLASMMLVACGSPSTPTPVTTVPGVWTGFYTTSPTTAATSSDLPYSAVILPDGTLTVYDGPINATTNKATGTWTYVGTAFKATYTYTGGSTFSVEATVMAANRLDGTWGSGTSTSGSGKFYWVKQ